MPTLYRNGRVRTPALPGATALLEADGAVAWVGEEADAPRADRVVDLAGGWLAPAFVDAHVHATSTGLALTGLDLTGCASLAEALRRVEEHARRARGGAVLGTGWDETAWPERRRPTAAELDRASYGGVVYLARTDVHSAVASSALLAACPEARSLPGFEDDGWVRMAAHHAVRRTARESLRPDQVASLQRATLDRAAALGIGCVHECGGPEIAGEDDFVQLLGLDHAVERLGYWGEAGAVERARQLGAVGAAGDLFVDGSLGSRTACLTEPYADDPGSRGELYLGLDAVTEHVEACTQAGVQAGFHAIGDRALTTVALALDAAAQRLGPEAVRRARHRVEHLEMPTGEVIGALARHHVVASVQPAFDARWGGPDGMYAERLGAERARPMNPYAALVGAGVALALGSDSPVTPLDPWGTVRAAVEHRTAGSGLSAPAAFAAHTRGGWAGARRDAEGELVPGAPATFAVWQVEEWDGELPALAGVAPTCVRTVVRGRTAHEQA